MYEKYIEILNPKPIFNLKWYKGIDNYSEGDIENTVLQLIAENEPGNYSKVINENFSWSSYYHLTYLRENILNWYPFEPDSEVLEIGCGMGAITNVLCDRCKKVTAVELSKRRATATLLRCREKENLEIIVGNMNDIQFDKKFDYITLIGVFEYQGNYTESENPYVDFLYKIKGLLKPSGKLLIAIENQYGLKYWCGAREDHTGIPFDGINQYDFSEKKVRTFSKAELEQMVRICGFENTFFYYPMPDYKLPTVVYSQNYLPKDNNMLNMNYYYIPDNKTLVAQEDKIYHDIIENGVFEFFANSFLLECSEAGKVGEVIFACMSNRRLSEYQIATRFTKDSNVEKFALCLPDGKQHINEIVNNESELKNRGIKVWQSKYENSMIRSPFCGADTVEHALLKMYRKKDKNSIIATWDKLYDQILSSSDTVEWQNNILYSFYPEKNKDENIYGPILKKGFLDMILRNAFLINDDFYWFDQEWTLENVPAIFIIYRAIIETYSSYPEMEHYIPIVELAVRYRLVDAWDDLQLIENLFSGAVIDIDHYVASRKLPGCSVECCANAINKILQ